MFDFLRQKWQYSVYIRFTQTRPIVRDKVTVGWQYDYTYKTVQLEAVNYDKAIKQALDIAIKDRSGWGPCEVVRVWRTDTDQSSTSSKKMYYINGNL